MTRQPNTDGSDVRETAAVRQFARKWWWIWRHWVASFFWLVGAYIAPADSPMEAMNRQIKKYNQEVEDAE